MQCSIIYYIRLREHFQQYYIAYFIDKKIKQTIQQALPVS